MKENVFNALLTAAISAVISFIVILQEPLLTNAEILSMGCVGIIGGLISGLMKMFVVDRGFDKWAFLSYLIGVIITYMSIVLGILFRLSSY